MVCYHLLLEGIFLIQGPNPHLLCLLHWQADSLPATSATWEDHTHTHTHTHKHTHSLFCTPKLIQSYVLLLAAKSLQLCPTLCNPRDSSPPGLPVPGILQARTLEWAAISFSNAWKWNVKLKSLSRSRLLVTPGTARNPMDRSWPHGLQPTRLLRPWIFQARVLEWGAIAFSEVMCYLYLNKIRENKGEKR